jgi:predicted nucleic acid-binding protein
VLDTSVLIALVDADDVHHPAARDAIEDGRAAGDRFVVPVAAYAEYMVRAFQHDPAEADFRDSIIEALPATVEAASRAIGREAAALRARYGRRLPLPDALIVGTAIRLGADQVLTADAGWPELDITVRIVVAA